MIERITKVTKVDLSKDNKQFNEHDKRTIRTLYFRYFGKDKTFKSNCGSCYVDAYILLNSLYKNPSKLTQMENRKFKLKDGKQIALHSLGVVYTNANLTDKAAVTILKTSKAHINSFSEFPENWESIVSGGKVAEPVEEEKGGFEFSTDESVDLYDLSKKELKELAEENEFDKSEWSKLNKTQLVEYLSDKL